MSTNDPKTILCFGDSLTWGFNAETRTRFSPKKRWTGILQTSLGAGYRIIEEGLNGRTTAFDDQFSPYRSGIEYLPMLLESHTPIDLVIVMLGSNDLQPHRNATARDSAKGCFTLLKQIAASRANPEFDSPKILLMAPPEFKQPIDLMTVYFGDDACKESQKFGKYYQHVADLFGASFIDTNQIISSDPIDGIHLSPESNKILAEHLHHKILEVFG